MGKDELKLGELNKAKGGSKGKKGGEKKKGVNGEGSNGPMGLYEIIFALSFTYHPSLPFIQGGTSQPAPITFAKHFAEKFSQLITAEDKKIQDLRISKNLTNQPQIITGLCQLPQKLPTNEKKGGKGKKIRGMTVDRNHRQTRKEKH